MVKTKEKDNSSTQELLQKKDQIHKLPPISTKDIKNKVRRSKVFVQQLKQKSKEKKQEKERKKREREILGDKAPPLEIPKTIENTRVPDHTVVAEEDEEVMKDEEIDEFEEFFKGQKEPNVLITATQRAHKETYQFIDEFSESFPKSTKLHRKNNTVSEMIKWANEKEFTDLVVVNDDGKRPNGMIVIHLPAGPTAYFKITNIEFRSEIANCGQPSGDKPELILNNFDTRLGHTFGRIFSSLFCIDPNFKGRRVITFHNQRDFIFFRSHRYVFSGKEEEVKVRLQETGPRFCMTVKWLQKGAWEKDAQFIFKTKKELTKGQRKKFHL